MIKFGTKPLSSIHTHLCLLIWTWWLMHSRQRLLDLKKNLKHWLLIIRYRFGWSYYALFSWFIAHLSWIFNRAFLVLHVFGFICAWPTNYWILFLIFHCFFYERKRRKACWYLKNLWFMEPTYAGSNWFTQQNFVCTACRSKECHLSKGSRNWKGIWSWCSFHVTEIKSYQAWLPYEGIKETLIMVWWRTKVAVLQRYSQIMSTIMEQVWRRSPYLMVGWVEAANVHLCNTWLFFSVKNEYLTMFMVAFCIYSFTVSINSPRDLYFILFYLFTVIVLKRELYTIIGVDVVLQGGQKFWVLES